MNIVSKASLYFNTLRYLKVAQIISRLFFHFRHPKPDFGLAPRLSNITGRWKTPAARPSSLVAKNRFRFLNLEGSLESAADWNTGNVSKLWLYNLHYFDDLNAKNWKERSDLHLELVQRWISQNPPVLGNGWEPYPLSMRIVNWIKWALNGNAIDEQIAHSLAVQVRYLGKKLEYHLLGNHLFVNAKALLFAGCFFQGREAESWLDRGIKILRKQIPEQILPDGGQFERSPMYHALAYEDMLDMINLFQAFPQCSARYRELVESWSALVARMGRWLATMTHPDGQIAFFNDAAMGIAPEPRELFEYAKRLGLEWQQPMTGTTWLEESGYVRIEVGSAVLFADVAPIGPDYLPGHAHADTLSYELSLFGQRVIVNGGVSQYGSGPQRDLERGTAAHNTVEVDGQNSSEVWSGFRVARRACPFDIELGVEGDVTVLAAAHNGYRRLPGRPVHRRGWRISNNCLEVNDFVEGRFHVAMSRIHFHPLVRVTGDGRIVWNGGQAQWSADSTAKNLTAFDWHPEFGVSVSSNMLELHMNGRTNPIVSFRIAW